MIKRSAEFFKTAAQVPKKEVSLLKEMVRRPEFAFGVGATAVGAGLNMARDAFRAAMEARDKAKAYKDMVALHPHLEQQVGEPTLRRLHNTLYNTNPHFAKDPTLAGAVIDDAEGRNQNFGGAAAPSHQGMLLAMKDLAGVRNQVSSARRAEGELGRGTDYRLLGKDIGGQMAMMYTLVDKEHGELAKAHAKIDELGDKLTAKSVRNHFQEVTGVPPGPRQIQAIAHAANAYASSPEIAALAHALADHPSKTQQILDKYIEK